MSDVESRALEGDCERVGVFGVVKARRLGLEKCEASTLDSVTTLVGGASKEVLRPFPNGTSELLLW